MLAAAVHDGRVLAVGSLATVALVVFVAYRQASKRAEREFFVALERCASDTEQAFRERVAAILSNPAHGVNDSTRG